MKRYLQSQNARGLTHIMMLDVDKIRTEAMNVISHYKTEKDTTKIVVVKSYFI